MSRKLGYLQLLWKNRTPNHRHWIKLTLIARDGRYCNTRWGHGCGMKLKMAYATIDHVIPMDAGGDPFDLDNMQLLCIWCHRKKDEYVQSSTLHGNAKYQEARFPLAGAMLHVLYH